MNIYWITKINHKTFFKNSRTEVANELRNRGHQVTLIMERNIGEKHSIDPQMLTLPTINCRFFSRILFGVVLLIYMAFCLRKKEIDVIIVDATNIWLPFMFPFRFFSIPIIYDVRTLSTDKDHSLETIYYDISFYLSSYLSDGITTITPELKDFLIKKYFLDNERIGLWTSGASKKFITTNLCKKKESQILHLMYHGTYEQTRGIETIIEAISDIKMPLRDKVKFTIVGVKKNTQKDLKNLCIKLGILDNITLVPPVDHQEILSYIDSCDIGIIPLPINHIWWRVSAPIKTLEYLARGKPIIATAIPFHQRIFNKGECGLLIEDDDKNSIKRAIETMYQKRDKLEDMGKQGRALVKNSYTWEYSAIDLEIFIKKIISMRK